MNVLNYPWHPPFQNPSCLGRPASPFPSLLSTCWYWRLVHMFLCLTSLQTTLTVLWEQFKIVNTSWSLDPFCVPRTMMMRLPMNFSAPPTKPIRHVPPSILSYRWESGRLETQIGRWQGNPGYPTTEPHFTPSLTLSLHQPPRMSLPAITASSATSNSLGHWELLTFEILIFNPPPHTPPTFTWSCSELSFMTSTLERPLVLLSVILRCP